MQANTALAEADSAYAHANSGYTQANTGTTHASAAFLQANTALTEANSAYEHANSAYIKANSAYDYANTRFASAGGTISGNVAITGHITPSTTLTSNIGNSTNRFHTVFVGPGSVDVDGIKIQNTAGVLTFTGATDINLGAGVTSISGLSTYSNSAYAQANTGRTHASSAYDKANSGYTQANTGTTHASSAYDKANSGYTQANTATTHASSAYDKANSGYTQANTGTTHAMSAYDKANSGYTQANTGTTHAAAAYTQANTGTTHAQGAFSLANTRFATAGGTISGDVTVTGNLTISGVTTTVSANNLSIQDNMIYLNNGAGSNTYPDIGFAANYSNGTYQHTGLFRDQTDGFWKFFDGYKPEPDASIYIDTSNSSFRLAPLQVSSVTATTSNVGTVQTGTWQGTSISTTYTDAKITSVGGQTGAISNTQLLNFLIAVDGAGSGLDADLLDGQSGSYYQDATNINAGTLAAARLATSGVTAGVYGSASIHPVITVDTYGRVTAVTNTSIAIASGAVSGLATSATTDTTNATNISSGTLAAARLATSGVVAGTFASGAIIPVITVDTYGRVTAVTNTSVAIASGAVSGLAASATTDTTNATNIGSGTLAAARLAASGVTAGVYGSASIHPVITVDAAGRVTAVTNTSVAIASGAVSGLATSATTDTTNATNISSGTLAAARLATSGVVAGTFASGAIIPVITVDTYGRVTAVTNTSVAIASGAVSGLAASATTDTTNASNIGSGTLAAARLATSGVTAGTFASGAIIPVITVDTYGRVTAVTNTSVAIAAAAVSGLATSATTDTTNASNITSGTLAVARLPTTSIANTGTFTSSTITIDAYGRVTAAANGASGGGGSFSSGKAYFYSGMFTGPEG